MPRNNLTFCFYYKFLVCTQNKFLREKKIKFPTKNTQKKFHFPQGVPIRAYTPQHQGPLFDDDPGIMSEVETASTGFRRGGKQRSSLPVVRTPSKTLERPLGNNIEMSTNVNLNFMMVPSLGLVFLQYRSETKRALLPNEITSIDTVRALFVRSFPRQLSMAYLEGPNVKIYIHDSSKDMFYELEDVRWVLLNLKRKHLKRQNTFSKQIPSTRNP